MIIGVNVDVLFSNNNLMHATFAMGRAALVATALNVGVPAPLGPVGDAVGWTLKWSAWFYAGYAVTCGALVAGTSFFLGIAEAVLDNCSGVLQGDSFMAFASLDPPRLTFVDRAKEGMCPKHINMLFPPRLPKDHGLPDGVDECEICGLPFQTDQVWRRLPCGHAYHAECIDKWVADHDTCPKCRACHTLMRRDLLSAEMLAMNQGQLLSNDADGRGTVPMSPVSDV